MAKDSKKKARKKHKAKDAKNGERTQALTAPETRWTRPAALAIAAGAIVVAGITSLLRIRR